MRVFRGYEEIKESLPKPVLTIGNYDGLHLGHRQIISSAIDRARAIGGVSVVFTFRPHPHVALDPRGSDADLQLINTYDEKLDLLAAMGVDVVVEQPFSREFSTIKPAIFFRDVIVKRICAQEVRVGYDFGFGKDRSGSIEMLRRFCEEEGVTLDVAKPLKIEGEICSSSRIREHLKAGEVTRANALLGREFFYRGLVVKGNGRGRKIGFATANVKTESKLGVKEGVYATWAVHKEKRFASVTNVGRQPTFNKGADVPVTVETHLFGFDADIYGETIEVRMVERLRDEKRFDGVESLVQQIGRDVESARGILEARG